MAESSESATTSLSPSWKNHLPGYAISVLLIPLFGIGLIGLYWIYKRQHRESYEFSNTQIRSQDDKYQRNIDLISIRQVEVQQSWLQNKTGVGDLVLHTSASSMTLHGLKNPHSLKRLLDKAITTEKQRHQQREKTKPQEPEYNPGTMDRMEYLTGLWQQGLVSDEDYEKEKKHFE